MEIKMYLKRFFFILLLMIIFATTYNYSQPRFDVDEQVQRLSNELDLSEEQADLVAGILTDSKAKAENLRGSGRERREMMLQMRDLMEATNKELESILTDEQLVKFKEIVQKRKEEMRRRRSLEY